MSSYPPANDNLREPVPRTWTVAQKKDYERTLKTMDMQELKAELSSLVDELKDQPGASEYAILNRHLAAMVREEINNRTKGR